MKLISLLPLPPKKQRTKLTVFSETFHFNQNVTRLFYLSPRLVNKFSRKFRSIFGFLRPKQFITRVRYKWLGMFPTNPNSRGFQKWVLSTKKYTTKAICGELVSLISPGLSELSTKSALRQSCRKQFSWSRNKLKFLLFRHKVFNYTTPKVQTYNQFDYFYTVGWGSDIRTGYYLTNHPLSLPNLDTVSTYNWKEVN